ncbi:hypothetical protein DWU98_12675 [Dyella monticola]|uniref:Uncharacterized protein n=1 Tax=Dyella monticola TaxID=1927958 RepID=A0A370WXV2_9GAMM|nr:hypothetical protein [Dyella monticola]RDS80805.1 hypothetical protein DWU98_12675 [Dyella monticola]
MSEEPSTSEAVFLDKARAAFDDLFERTRAKDELNFVLSLSGEFKPYTYTSAMESQRAFRDYDEFMALDQFRGRPIRLRVAFSYYLYTAESAGLWCIPMAVMGVLAGGHYNIDPFNRWVRQDKATGQNVGPNANKVMSALESAATDLGLNNLAEVFRDAFDNDLRNAIAHSDYVVSPSEGVYVRGRHDHSRLIRFPELDSIVHRGIGLLYELRNAAMDAQRTYETPKAVFGTTNDRDPPGWHALYSDPVEHTFSVIGGHGLTEESVLELAMQRNRG